MRKRAPKICNEQKRTFRLGCYRGKYFRLFV